MKSFFDYMSELKSSDLALAIGAPIGAGPFCGFGRGDIDANNNVLTLYPYSNLENQANPAKDTVVARTFNQQGANEGPRINFGCISRDSQVYINTDSSIPINIQGTREAGDTRYYNEVFLFAYHTKVSEPVENPVTLMAYWNQSSISFYRMFKEAQDVYYPSDTNIRMASHDPVTNPKFTYDYLEAQVRACCPIYDQNFQSTMVLIGVYGTGINNNTSLDESFAIVPYFSKWPAPMNYNSALHSVLKKSIENIESKFQGLEEESTLIEYIDKRIAELKEQDSATRALSLLPIGSIILWEGDTIPDGWEEYNKAYGKVIMGYQPGGIYLDGKTILEKAGDVYTPLNPYHITLTTKDIPAHVHGMGTIDVKWGGTSNTRPFPSSYDLRQGSYNNGDTGATNGVMASSKNFSDLTNKIENNQEETMVESMLPTVTLRLIKKIK